MTFTCISSQAPTLWPLGNVYVLVYSTVNVCLCFVIDVYID